MLELHEPAQAFERLEDWLRGEGFFAPGGEPLVADLYLGYGLSSTIRRTVTPAPPEPAALPLVACVVRSGNYGVEYDNGATRAGVALSGRSEQCRHRVVHVLHSAELYRLRGASHGSSTTPNPRRARRRMT